MLSHLATWFLSPDKQQSIHCQNILCEAAIQRVCVVEEKTSKERWSGVSSFAKTNDCIAAYVSASVPKKQK